MCGDLVSWLACCRWASWGSLCGGRTPPASTACWRHCDAGCGSPWWCAVWGRGTGAGHTRPAGALHAPPHPLNTHRLAIHTRARWPWWCAVWGRGTGAGHTRPAGALHAPPHPLNTHRLAIHTRAGYTHTGWLYTHRLAIYTWAGYTQTWAGYTDSGAGYTNRVWLHIHTRTEWFYTSKRNVIIDSCIFCAAFLLCLTSDVRTAYANDVGRYGASICNARHTETRFLIMISDRGVGSIPEAPGCRTQTSSSSGSGQNWTLPKCRMAASTYKARHGPRTWYVIAEKHGNVVRVAESLTGYIGACNKTCVSLIYVPYST